MIQAAHALEESLFALLKADNALQSLLGGCEIYREPRRSNAFPYLTLGVTFSRDWSTGTETGDKHQLQIHVWADNQSQTLVRSILARLDALLTAPSLVLVDHHLVNLQRQRSEVRQERKPRLLHGVMQWRAVTEVRTA